MVSVIHIKSKRISTEKIRIGCVHPLPSCPLEGSVHRVFLQHVGKVVGLNIICRQHHREGDIFGCRKLLSVCNRLLILHCNINIQSGGVAGLYTVKSNPEHRINAFKPCCRRIGQIAVLPQSCGSMQRFTSYPVLQNRIIPVGG